ncbi:MAG: hypothetical protein JO151_02355, partial [Verrucomicrobia bacterium]|nr:hypothetical protein [Verrucomicrobiota bacterium]
MNASSCSAAVGERKYEVRNENAGSGSHRFGNQSPQLARRSWQSGSSGPGCQEGTAVGVCAALNKDDFITSTFRGHGHALAKGLTPREMLDELFGAATGCCKGKGGSMHMGNMGKGMIPGIAIVAGGIPLAAGMALAFKM